MIEFLVQLFFTVPLLLAAVIVVMFLYMVYENLVSYFRIRYIRKHKDKIVVETEVTSMTYAGIKRVTYWFTVPARREEEYYRWAMREDGTPGEVIALCRLRDITRGLDHVSLWFKLETIDDSWFRIGGSHAGMKQVKEMLQDVSDEHFVMHKMATA